MVRWVVIRYPHGRRWFGEAEILSEEFDDLIEANDWRRERFLHDMWVSLARMINGKLAFTTSDDDMAIVLHDFEKA